MKKGQKGWNEMRDERRVKREEKRMKEVKKRGEEGGKEGKEDTLFSLLFIPLLSVCRGMDGEKEEKQSQESKCP